MSFGGLTVGVSCGDALTEGLEASQLCFDPTSRVVAGPTLPECPAIVARRAQGFVPDPGCRPLSFQGRPFLRSGITGMASRSMMACGNGGYRRHHQRSPWRSARREGPGRADPAGTGLSPSRLGVNSTARMSQVAGSMAR